MKAESMILSGEFRPGPKGGEGIPSGANHVSEPPNPTMKEEPRVSPGAT